MDTQTQHDTYYHAFIESKNILQQCQANKQLTSCLECAEIITCQTRIHYVNSVYENMNKGEDGGFDFN